MSMFARLKQGLGLLVLVGSSIAGCGGDSGPDLGKFEGTWNITTGTNALTCAGMTFSDPLTGTVVVSKGIDAPLIVTDDGCTIKYDVNGATATARSGQMCPAQPVATDFGAATITATLLNGTFTVNGLVANVAMSFNANLVVAGQTIACSGSQTETLQKVGK